MSYLRKAKRLEQCYVYVTHQLNLCGIRPDGAEIRPWLVDELHQIQTPSPVEIGIVLSGMWVDKVKFEGSPGSDEKFAAHPDFGGAGHKLKAKEQK